MSEKREVLEARLNDLDADVRHSALLGLMELVKSGEIELDEYATAGVDTNPHLS